MNLNENDVIGQLVSIDYRMASVFKSYGLDFCCNGGETLGQACKKQNINLNELILKLECVIKRVDSYNMDFKSLSPDLLVDYIEKRHHRYIESNIPEIKACLYKTCEVNGARHPELNQIKTLFNKSSVELVMHMKKEELIVFPFIIKMYKSNISGKAFEVPRNGSFLENPIKILKKEHENEWVWLRKIAELSNNYSPPVNVSNACKVAFKLLREFDNNLHLHIHLENNILFPWAIETEKKIHKMNFGSID